MYRDLIACWLLLLCVCTLKVLAENDKSSKEGKAEEADDLEAAELKVKKTIG